MIRVLVAAACLGALAAPAEAKSLNAGNGIWCTDVKLKSAKGVPSGAVHKYSLTAMCEGPDPNFPRTQTTGEFTTWKYRAKSFVTLAGGWDAKTSRFNEAVKFEGGGGGTVKAQFKCPSDPYLSNVSCALIAVSISGSQWEDLLQNKPLHGRPIGQGFVNAAQAAQLSQQSASSGAPPPPPPPPPGGKPLRQPLSKMAPAVSATLGMERNTDRPGSDYHGFPMAQPKPEKCRDACKSDARCRAWTYVRPGLKGPKAACFLKNAVPPKRADTCCVSGVK